MALGDAMVKTGTGSVIADLIVNGLGASPSQLFVLSGNLCAWCVRGRTLLHV